MLKNNKGITLIELLIALSLTSLVTMLAVQMYITNTNTLKTTETQARLISQAQYVSERMTYFGTQSIGITEVLINGSSYLDEKIQETNVEAITFKISDKSYTFKYEDQVITLNDGEVLASNISKFYVLPLGGDVTYRDAKGIRLILELEASSGRRTVTHELSTVITFRNK